MYDFIELEKAALTEKTEEAINALADWYERYGREFWNGESYRGKGYNLRPIYSTVPNENEGFDIVGWEII